MYDTDEHNGFLVRDVAENEDAEQQYHSREKSTDQPQLVLVLAPSGPPAPPPPADTTAPETSIGQGAPDQTSDTAASFHFSSNETGSTFQCRLDSLQESAFTACTSPRIYSGLQTGSHRFEVRAIDAAGNKDQTPAMWTWVITVAPADTTAPQTTISNPPPATTQSTSATFNFSSSESGSTFTCSRDNAPFTSCLSPLTLTGFSVGPHTFAVKATDAAGNTDDTAATHSWTVTAPPPPNCGTQQTVSANADSWIAQNDTSKNNGSDSNLKVMSKSGGALRSLVRFNLPTLPAGCVVDTATLRLFSTGYKTGRTLQALKVNASWTEGGVTWSNQPATTGTAATASSGAGWREWNVATQVAAMYSTTNNGFLIRDATENQDAEQQFSSREKGSDQPQLVIKFKPGP